MKLAIIGGTFDPLHIGHLFLADIVITELEYTKVLFVPANIPAHKTVDSATSAEQRLEMIALEIAQVQSVEVSDIEIRRGGTSYSIDTVRECKKLYPGLEGKPGLVIGDDLLSHFSEWKEYESLWKEADIIIARRDEKKYKNINFPHVYLDNPVLPISSSEIRHRIHEEKAFRYLVTGKIYAYIKEQKLYGLVN